MSRRTLSRHVRTHPLDDAVVRKYLLHYDAQSLYYHPEQFPRLCSACLFGNPAPLELEVGCGTAEFLCAQAAKEPGVNFVGVDVSYRPLYKAASIAASLALENARFIHANFTGLYPLLEPLALRWVYLHFPDPNMRPKFQRRKLISPTFLDHIHAALAPEGSLSIMTDHEAFFLEMLAIVELDGRFQKTHEARYLIGFEPEVKSRFQRIWERHGLPILRCELRKKDAGGYTVR